MQQTIEAKHVEDEQAYHDDDKGEGNGDVLMVECFVHRVREGSASDEIRYAVSREITFRNQARIQDDFKGFLDYVSGTELQDDFHKKDGLHDEDCNVN